MAILVRHGGNPTAAGYGAFGGGVGKGRTAMSQQAAGFYRERDPENKHTQHRGTQRGPGKRRGQDARTSRVPRPEMQQDQRPIYTGPAPGKGGLSWEDQFGARRERDEALQQDGDERADQFDWRIDREQRAEFERLESALERARESGLYTDDEMEELERQIHAKQLGVAAPRPHLPDDTPSLQEQVEEGTWTDPETGRIWGTGRSGNLEILADPQEKAQQQEQQRRKQAEKNTADALKRLQGRESERDPSSFTPEEVRAEIQQWDSLIEEVMGEATATGDARQPDAVATTAAERQGVKPIDVQRILDQIGGID